MDLVVIGAVAAGMSAASKAKRIDPETRVQVFGREEHVSYAACGLPYYIGDVIQDQKKLIARSQEQFAHQGIEVNPGHEVKQIIPEQKQILVLNPRGREMVVNYDKLIICTGARPVVPSLAGQNLEGVFSLATLPDSQQIKTAIAAGAKRAAIVGAGYIGLEMVEAFRLQGLSVTLLQRSDQVARTIDPDMASIVQDYLTGNGVEVRTEVEVQPGMGPGPGGSQRGYKQIKKVRGVKTLIFFLR